MEIIRLLIIYEDKEYGTTLGKAISSLHRDFLITVDSFEKFSKQEFLKNYDLILVEGRQMQALNFSTANPVILLGEEVCEKLDKQLISMDSNSDALHLCKFTKVSQLVKDLRYIYGYITGKTNVAKDNISTKVIGFLSASGGTGKSVISISVARDLAKYQDKSVLYVSFDAFSATAFYNKNSPSNRCIGDYLYYLFNKDKENLCSYIDSFVFSDEYGVNTFISLSGINELNQLNREELSHFFETILASNRYEYVIIDMACQLSDPYIFLMGLCSKLFLIESNCPSSTYKSRNFIDYFDQIKDVISVDDNLIRVVNKVASNGFSQESLLLEEETLITIERDDNSFHYEEDYLNISINHLFGMGIKKVVNEIL